MVASTATILCHLAAELLVSVINGGHRCYYTLQSGGWTASLGLSMVSTAATIFWHLVVELLVLAVNGFQHCYHL